MRIERILGKEMPRLPNFHIDVGLVRRNFVVECYGMPTERISNNFWKWDLLINSTKRCVMTHDSDEFRGMQAGTVELHWSRFELSDNEIKEIAQTLRHAFGRDTTMMPIELINS